MLLSNRAESDFSSHEGNSFILQALRFREEMRLWVAGQGKDRGRLTHGPFNVWGNDTKGTVIGCGKILKNNLTYSISMLVFPILDR